MNMIEIINLSKYYRLDHYTTIKALQGISLSIKNGEIFGLAGESGSGKSTLSRCLAGIVKPDDGKIYYKGIEISKRNITRSEKMEATKGIHIIFQDPVSSMNPRMQIKDIIEEPMKLQNIEKNKKARIKKIHEYLLFSELEDSVLKCYPSELSGGQNQRVCIARALACEPDFIIADEPTASLDVFVQSQIIALFQKLQREIGMSCLFVSHNLLLLRQICSRIGVMYQGRIIEIGEAEDVFLNPLHPYTKSLLSAIPMPDPAIKMKRIQYIPGKIGKWKEEGNGHGYLTEE